MTTTHSPTTETKRRRCGRAGAGRGLQVAGPSPAPPAGRGEARPFLPWGSTRPIGFLPGRAGPPTTTSSLRLVLEEHWDWRAGEGVSTLSLHSMSTTAMVRILQEGGVSSPPPRPWPRQPDYGAAFTERTARHDTAVRWGRGVTASVSRGTGVPARRG